MNMNFLTLKCLIVGRVGIDGWLETLEEGHSRSNQYSHVTYHLRICSFLVHKNIPKKCENPPNFSSMSLLVPELQHIEVGIFRGKHVFAANMFIALELWTFYNFCFVLIYLINLVFLFCLCLIDLV